MTMLSVRVIDSEYRLPIDITVSASAYPEFLRSFKLQHMRVLAVLIQDIDLDQGTTMQVWLLSNGKLAIDGEVYEYIARASNPQAGVSANAVGGRKNQLDHLRPTETRGLSEADI